MKKILIFLVLFFPVVVFARAGGGGVHNNTHAKYDCSVTKKPGTPKWVTGIKSEKLNDGSITLTWADSRSAHEVEIKYNSKTKKTGDDSQEKIAKLTNGKTYSFRVRGISNCG
jgi:hypothetical protein